MGLLSLRTELKSFSFMIYSLISEEQVVLNSIQNFNGLSIGKMETALFSVETAKIGLINFSNALASVKYSVSTQLEEYLLFYIKELQTQTKYINKLKAAYSSLISDIKKGIEYYAENIANEFSMAKISAVNTIEILKNTEIIMQHTLQLGMLDSKTKKALIMISTGG